MLLWCEERERGRSTVVAVVGGDDHGRPDETQAPQLGPKPKIEVTLEPGSSPATVSYDCQNCILQKDLSGVNHQNWGDPSVTLALVRPPPRPRPRRLMTSHHDTFPLPSPPPTPTY